MRVQPRRLLLKVAPTALALIACAVEPPAAGDRPVEGARAQRSFLASSLSDAELEALERSVPNLHVVVGLSPEEALRRAPEFHGIDGRYCTSEFLRVASSLCWVQAGSAGVERYLVLPELALEERIVLTNMKGVHGPAIADHVFAMLLALSRDIPRYVDPARRGQWDRGDSDPQPFALQDRTLLVVGLGGIGSEVARRAKGFGMRVLATRRSGVPAPAFVDRQGRPEELFSLLPEADVVVLCVPLTAETTGMIGARELRAMKPGAYLVNVARGKLVDTQALVEALRAGRLAGACLDVTDPEPLPPDHPLWSLPGVVITPHVAGRSELTDERRRALYLENLLRFGRGEPLLNVVDKRAGY